VEATRTICPACLASSLAPSHGPAVSLPVDLSPTLAATEAVERCHRRPSAALYRLSAILTEPLWVAAWSVPLRLPPPGVVPRRQNVPLRKLSTDGGSIAISVVWGNPRVFCGLASHSAIPHRRRCGQRRRETATPIDQAWRLIRAKIGSRLRVEHPSTAMTIRRRCYVERR